MWLSQIVELLKPSRSVAAGARAPRRAGRSRPPAVEPLEDRLLMTGQTDLDVVAGTKGRHKPNTVMTFVLEVAVNWLGPAWLGGTTVGTPSKPDQGGGGPDTHGGFNGRVDLSSLGVSSLPALVTSTPGTDLSGPLGLAATAPPVAADAGAVTPAKLDTFFQALAAVSSF